MKRVLLTAAMQFAIVAIAYGQAPQPAPSSVPPPAPPVESTAAAAVPAPYPDTAPSPYGEPPEDIDAQRAAIWNSPEMIEARRRVFEHGQRSRQFSPQDAQRYLSRIRQASPTEMRQWLERQKAIQARIAWGMLVEKAARQARVQQAFERIQDARQSYANIDLGKTQAALTAREQRHEQQLLSQQLVDAIRTGRDDTVAMTLQRDFNPLAPNFDPASPDAYTRWAAAASLPGDLPPGDSRNFIEGEEGVDFGDGATEVGNEGGGPGPPP
jgi:hypothetical protein